MPVAKGCPQVGEGYKVALKEAKPYPPGRSLLTKVKDALTMEKLSKVVYWVLCSCGTAYIGETVRRPEIRMKEHRDACQMGALEKSALALLLLLKEAIHIRLLNPLPPPLPQQDGGLELPGCWMAALKGREA